MWSSLADGILEMLGANLVLRLPVLICQVILALMSQLVQPFVFESTVTVTRATECCCIETACNMYYLRLSQKNWRRMRVHLKCRGL